MLSLVAASEATIVAASEAPNPWFSRQYVESNSDALVAAFSEHVYLTWTSVLVGVLLAVPLALLARRNRTFEALVLGVEGVIYTVPALALFALLLPVFGLSALVVQIGLTSYTLLVITRNTVTGLAGVPADVREAAVGMGFGRLRLLLRVELPLALPAIVAGIRVATVTTVALVTVGAFFGYGGLGTLIYQGYNNNFFRAEIMTATVLCVALALVLDLLLYGAQRLSSPWARRQEVR